METGRTHQIRVHFAFRRRTLIGDPLYGRLMIPSGCSSVLKEALSSFKRQALCASRLELIHPSSGKIITLEVEPAADFKNLLHAMKLDLLPNDK